MENSLHYRPTQAIVDLEAIRANVRNLKEYLGSETSVIAVVKADGYGHGEVEVARAAFEAGAEMVSVATPDEAVRLRVAGISGDILVMGPSPLLFAEKAAELRIMLTVSSAEWLQSALETTGSFVQQLKIHVKLDTGMGRIGIRDACELQSLVSAINNSNQVLLDGIFTHFACADEESPEVTKEQFSMFIELVKTLPEKPRLVHASNSAATLLYPEYALDAVRFGIGLYGIAPSEYVGGKLPFGLEKSFRFESELAFVKLLEMGRRISYGGTYETSGPEWIGTIPVGYADGLRRGLRGQEVLIGGERMPIVGTICMDQCMVKLSREMSVGEKVVLIGRQGGEEITMEEWAERLDTIPYEIAVSITKRVPRIYTGVDGQYV
ncbi:alanine racemase [Sporosarcina sp. ANT_H38]|uniref:alanine racemase n=1 Tax=Sporosarcina sp. ANT_H38 TaxID=2597358 RepID=UPI0011F0D664|nr:alanine racemase [Sporosarcina sp. ANT_H38]KAA0948420.1 alanine racemase [Sporosarcina sp. ANT_H38]